MKSIIYAIERNIHGAIVIYGAAGIRQYYGYSLKESKERYLKEYQGKYYTNE